jgi:hypothetical protein
MQIHPGRPVSAPPRQQRRGPARASSSSSVTGRRIGIAVFLLGLAAVLGAGYAAYAVLWQDAAPGQGAVENPAAGLPQDALSLEGAAEAAIPPESGFQGVWEAAFSGGQSAVIAFNKGRYQIVIAEEAASPLRLYGQGSYVYDGATGLAELRPDYTEPPQAPPGLIYKILTRRVYKLLVSLNAGTGRLFLKPFVVGDAYDQVHPLFYHTRAGEALTGWTRRKPASQKGD